jgi:D-alanyl-D-alanine carboxypeptidase
MPQFSPTLWNLFDWANRVDVDNDPLVLFSYSKDFVGHPCSMTKVMTAILLCENYVNLNQVVTVHESDRQPPSGFDFKAGDQVRLSDFVKCLMVQSSNTSAHVIARVVGGILLDRDANVMA